MKRTGTIYAGCLAAAVALLLPATGFAGLVIGDWETDLDGWADWSSGATLTGGQTEGVTLGSGSILVDQTGWGQSRMALT